MSKLDEPMPLGYSSAGIVLECGFGVQEFKPGDRIAMAAPHAGVVSVSKNLCAKIPDNVSFADAVYTSVASIALEGVRLAKLQLGESALVIGLGLIGQITVCLLKAQGCRVFGLDPSADKVALALTLGADAAATVPSRDAIKAFSDGFGVDAALITAATDSNGPIGALCGRLSLEGPHRPRRCRGLESSPSAFFCKRAGIHCVVIDGRWAHRSAVRRARYRLSHSATRAGPRSEICKPFFPRWRTASCRWRV